MACKGCGTELRQREDDEEGTVRKRLDVHFKETTHSLIEYYQKKAS